MCAFRCGPFCTNTALQAQRICGKLCVLHTAVIHSLGCGGCCSRGQSNGRHTRVCVYFVCLFTDKEIQKFIHLSHMYKQHQCQNHVSHSPPSSHPTRSSARPFAHHSTPFLISPTLYDNEKHINILLVPRSLCCRCSFPFSFIFNTCSYISKPGEHIHLAYTARKQIHNTQHSSSNKNNNKKKKNKT